MPTAGWSGSTWLPPRTIRPRCTTISCTCRCSTRCGGYTRAPTSPCTPGIDIGAGPPKDLRSHIGRRWSWATPDGSVRHGARVRGRCLWLVGAARRARRSRRDQPDEQRLYPLVKDADHPFWTICVTMCGSRCRPMTRGRPQRSDKRVFPRRAQLQPRLRRSQDAGAQQHRLQLPAGLQPVGRGTRPFQAVGTCASDTLGGGVSAFCRLPIVSRRQPAGA